MGLPQASSSNMAEEMVASLTTFVHTPPQLLSLSSCDLSGVHVGRPGNQISSTFPCSPARELTQDPDALNLHEAHLHQLRIGSIDKTGLFAHKGGQNVHGPVSRIVGFEPRALDSPSSSAFKGNQIVGSLSSNLVSSYSSETAITSSLARKRLLSPWNGMLVPDQFEQSLSELVVDRLYEGHCWVHLRSHCCLVVYHLC